MSCRDAGLGLRVVRPPVTDIPHEREQLTHCRLRAWANEPEALFRRTEMMSVIWRFSAVRSLYKPSHTQSRKD